MNPPPPPPRTTSNAPLPPPRDGTSPYTDFDYSNQDYSGGNEGDYVTGDAPPAPPVRPGVGGYSMQNNPMVGGDDVENRVPSSDRRRSSLMSTSSKKEDLEPCSAAWWKEYWLLILLILLALGGLIIALFLSQLPCTPVNTSRIVLTQVFILID